MLATHKVLILGGDSDHNLGDAAILSALCHYIATTRPGIQITVTSSVPDKKPGLPGVNKIIRRGIGGAGDLARSARESNLVIIGGGGLFQDDDSRIKMPFWAAKLALLQLTNQNIAGLCLGAGPLKHPESKFFARMACSGLRSISVRDHYARQALAECNVGPVDVVPDPAFMLRPAPVQQALDTIKDAGISTNRPIIGIAIRRWFHRLGGMTPHRVRYALKLDQANGLANMNLFLDELAIALKQLASRLDASILLLPTYNVAHEADIEYCRMLANKLSGISVGIAKISDPHIYKAVTGRLALMIASRMHPLILAAGMGTPIVGLAYNKKFDGMFDLLGMRERPLWLNHALDGSLTSRLETLFDTALSGQPDLQAKTEVLANQVMRHTAELLAKTHD